ncbi:hypothetical protein E4582_06055 [Luteimonas yindakuii]|uniref:Uncharacterized protein n=1 Tax=Luteimonas yindakuii TaxID=2565782 RepID=A0A4Z1R729_9GAMM|nr:hypothetical protein [Luteimonas yindakuii]TKS54375.1 hypothetical protein E4582_06055 [Luteimonas yindakuii]
MNLQKLTIIFALLIPLQSVIAATPRWQSEPTAVFGVELGAPLSEDIPTCPPIDYRNYRPRDSFCKESSPYSEGSLAIVRFDKIPMGNILSTIEAFTYDGVVGAIHASSPHGNYQQFRAVLIERYGQPTSIKTDTVRTKAGVDWTSEVLTWSGTNVTIQLHERYDTVTASTMVVTHLQTISARQVERESAVKKAASEL